MQGYFYMSKHLPRHCFNFSLYAERIINKNTESSPITFLFHSEFSIEPSPLNWLENFVMISCSPYENCDVCKLPLGATTSNNHTADTGVSLTSSTGRTKITILSLINVDVPITTWISAVSLDVPGKNKAGFVLPANKWLTKTKARLRWSVLFQKSARLNAPTWTIKSTLRQPGTETARGMLRSRNLKSECPPIKQTHWRWLFVVYTLFATHVICPLRRVHLQRRKISSKIKLFL